MKNFNYLIYRTGSNAANQPMTFEPVPIAIVQAPNRDAACEHVECERKDCAFVAQSINTTVYANQHLHAVPRSKANPTDWDSVLAEDNERLVLEEQSESEQSQMQAELAAERAEFYEHFGDEE